MKSHIRKMGRNPTAVESEKAGPYAVIARRVSGGTNGRITIGTNGSSIGVKHRAGRSTDEGDYDQKTIYALRETMSLQAPFRGQARLT